jgi:hypothetical protein
MDRRCARRAAERWLILTDDDGRKGIVAGARDAAQRIAGSPNRRRWRERFVITAVVDRALLRV